MGSKISLTGIIIDPLSMTNFCLKKLCMNGTIFQNFSTICAKVGQISINDEIFIQEMLTESKKIWEDWLVR